jgi:hypothetical protein
MHPNFTKLTESLHENFERLVGMPPCSNGSLPKSIPKKGVYLFSENGKHLYVGRSNNIRNRYAGHTLPSSRQYSAAFAMILARRETGRKPSYRQGADSRKGLMEDVQFCEVFERQKSRIRTMDFRFVEEVRPLEQTLLEIYCAVVLNTEFNDFDNH